jgi:hypothetical protein
MDSPLPFPFWNPDPAEWVSDLGHDFEVLFEGVLDDERLERLGRLYAEHFSRGPGEPLQWLWSGPFARFSVGVRWVRMAHSAAFDQVARFLLAAHELAPIREVIMVGGVDPLPADLRPGPAFEPMIRPVDPSLDPPGPNAAFDTGWDEVAAAQKAARRKSNEARIEAALSTAPKGKVGLRRADPVERPSQAAYPEAVRSRFAAGRGFFFGPIFRPYRWSGDFRRTVSWRYHGQNHSAKFGFDIGSVIAVRSDGLCALAWDNRTVFELDLSGGQTRSLWRGEPEDGTLSGAQYLAPDTWVVAFKNRTFVLQQTEQGIREVTRTNGVCSNLTVAADGRIVVAEVATGLTVYLWNGLALKTVGRFDLPELEFHAEISQEICLRTPNPHRDEEPPARRHDGWSLYSPDQTCEDCSFFALTGIAEIAGAEKRGKAKRKKTPHLALEPVPMEAVPGVVTVSEKERVRVSKRHTNLSLSDVRRRPVPSVVRSESGRLAALVGEGVVFLDDEGKQQLVPLVLVLIPPACRSSARRAKAAA